MPFDGTATTTPTQSFLDRVKRIFRATPAPVPAPIIPSNDPAVQVLTIARALIEDRKDWAQRRYETRDGRRCAVGALRGACRELNLHGVQPGARTALLSVAYSRGFKDIESMNDNSSHRQVLSAFDEAIGRVRFASQF